MKRRQAILGMAALACAMPARAARDQADGLPRPTDGTTQAGRKRLGMFGPYGMDSREELRRQLEKRGWVEGRTLDLAYVPWTSPMDGPGIAAGAKKVVASRPDAIVTVGTPATRALQAATSTIPIVTAIPADAVAEGFAQSLRQPGGNITGVCEDQAEARDMRISLLRQMLPLLATIYFLRRGTNPFDMDAAAAAARKAGLAAQVVSAGTSLDDYEAALRKVPPGGKAAVLAGNPPAGKALEDVPRIAARLGVPVLYGDRQLVKAGGLVSYAPVHGDPYGRVAALVDRMLRGDNPAQTPFELPTKSDLAINRAAAAALGISIPAALMLRADLIVG